jgi:glutaconate CoA-transferase, subunit A
LEMTMASLGELIGYIKDGSSVVLPLDSSGCAMAASMALIKRGVRDLHLIGAPVCGFQADMLIGAGCVARVEAAAVTLGEYGLAPRFSAALKSGEIEMWDSTCPALLAGLQAAEKGIPFIPLRGVVGSDLLRVRPDWKVIQNPLADSGVIDPVVVLPAIKPDVALFHAAKADKHGNVWVGVRRELMTMAHAARATCVTVETIEHTNFLDDPVMAAGTIAALYVTAISVVPGGAAPLGLAGTYEPDVRELARYAADAKTEAGFKQWLDAQLSVPA